MLRDLRHGFRVLMQARGWTAVVVLSLAVGIGANTAIFSAVNGMLLRTLSVHDPDSLVRLRTAGRNDMATDASDYGFAAESPLGPVRTTFPYPMYQHFREANQTMVDLAASVPVGLHDSHGGWTRGNRQRFAGNRKLLFDARRERAGRPHASSRAMTAPRHRRWRCSASGTGGRTSRADPHVIGRDHHDCQCAAHRCRHHACRLQRHAAPAAQNLAMSHCRLHSTRGFAAKTALHSATNWWVQIIGRLKPGMTVEQVQGNLAGVFREQARREWTHIWPASRRVGGILPKTAAASTCPQLIAESGRQGMYDANTNDCSRARDHRHRLGAGVAAGMRERRQPAPFARRRSASASCPSACRWERRARG